MGKPINWKPEELTWIKAHRTDVRRESHAKFCKKFNRENVSLKAYCALCKRNGWKTGRTGQYKKGNVPENKGKKMPYNENSARTQFKKGQKPHNTKYIGHERITKDGYIEICIDERNPHTGYKTRYVQKHKHLWEKEFGKVPEGMCLKCLDGNRQNTDPSNWEAIPRGALPFLNGFRGHDYDSASNELKKPILTLAKLRHKKSQKLKEAENNDR